MAGGARLKRWQMRDTLQRADEVEPRRLAKTLKYREVQEHLLRRLGSALVLHWDALPDWLQDLLIDQASVVEDRAEAPHAQADFETFIRTVRATPLNAPAAAAETRGAEA